MMMSMTLDTFDSNLKFSGSTSTGVSVAAYILESLANLVDVDEDGNIRVLTCLCGMNAVTTHRKGRNARQDSTIFIYDLS